MPLACPHRHLPAGWRPAALLGACLAAAASGPALGAAGSPASGSLHEQALTLATSLHWDDPREIPAPGAESPWPHVDYCGPELQRSGCTQAVSVLALHNTSAVSLPELRVCAEGRAAQQLELLHADADGCVRTTVAAHGALTLTVRQKEPGASYPLAHELHLLFGLPAWKRGAPLLELTAPILHTPSAQPLPEDTQDDDEFAIGVQERRLHLRAKLLVFTYHGDASSVAVVQRRELVDPDGGLRVYGAEQMPAVFARYRLPSCSTSAQAHGLRVHSLPSGRSCGLVVSGGKADTAPFTTSGRTRVRGTLRMGFHILRPRQQVDLVKNLPLLMQRVLVVGGEFDAAGGVGDYPLPVPGIVEVANGQFRAVPSLRLEDGAIVRSLALSPDGAQLYFGGQFEPLVEPGQPAPPSFFGVTNHVDTALWTPDNGPDGQVLAIAASGGLVYVGGLFGDVAQLGSAGVAALRPGDPLQPAADAEHWGALGQGVHAGTQATDEEPGNVHAILAGADGRVLVGGEFRWAREAPPSEEQTLRALRVPNLAAWDPQAQGWINFGGPTWAPPSPMYAGVHALAPLLGGVLLGGAFDRVGQPFGSDPYEVAADALAFYDPGPLSTHRRWHRLQPSPEGYVLAFADTVRGVFIGGRMRVPGGNEHVLLRISGPPTATTDPSTTCWSTRSTMRTSSSPRSTRKSRPWRAWATRCVSAGIS